MRRRDNATLIQQLQWFGASPEQIERIRRAGTEDAFEVMPENWPAYEVFETCTTQWRIAPSGQYQGIDYPAMESAMRLMNIRKPHKLFHEIQDFELGAVKEFSAAAKQRNGKG